MVEVALGCYASGTKFLARVRNEGVAFGAESVYEVHPSQAHVPGVFDRNYPQAAAIFGTADIVCTHGRMEWEGVGANSNNTVPKLKDAIVADWKTGISSAKYVARAKWQLRALAVGVAGDA